MEPMEKSQKSKPRGSGTPFRLNQTINVSERELFEPEALLGQHPIRCRFRAGLLFETSVCKPMWGGFGRGVVCLFWCVVQMQALQPTQCMTVALNIIPPS